ncbi:hypothetical protein [Bosea sp. 117]|uniref:hypothetical protein n=1 Tax=Bosea sp. 117 TaxID=1125973 RepID=UPI000B12FEB1|nr:hypothetical protein [Bosea sp. 117]
MLNEIEGRDEDTVHSGEALKLPACYAPCRAGIEGQLAPLAGRAPLPPTSARHGELPR